MAADIARTRRSSDWKRRSAGAGTKGPGLHDWCYLELADLEVEEFNTVNQALRSSDPSSYRRWRSRLLHHLVSSGCVSRALAADNQPLAHSRRGPSATAPKDLPPLASHSLAPDRAQL